MPLTLQPKLLRALQEREFDPLGSNHTVHVDIRVIATTNRPLEAAVAEGRFRADLYYRLNVIPLSLPALRDRAGDVQELAEHFAALYAPPGNAARLSGELMGRLEEQAWPGNVRELANFVRRAIALSRGGEIGVEALEHGKNAAGKVLAAGGFRAQSFPEKLSLPLPGHLPEWKAGLSLEEMERQLFAMTLESTGGNRARAAELLGVSLRTVRNKVREFGLPPRNNYGNALRNHNSNNNPNNNNNKEQPCP
jgi:DNA-binding NtrC family response regulator